MKKVFPELILCTLLLVACSESAAVKPERSASKSDTIKESVVDQRSYEEPQTGNYVGMFIAQKSDNKKDGMDKNKINLVIDSISGTSIWGHSVVAGNKRPWKGSIKEGEEEDSYWIEAKEPGDDKYDGVFYFNHYPKTGKISGSWKANDQKLAVSERRYALQKVNFRYNKNQDLGQEHMELVYGSDDGESYEAITLDAGKFNASKTKLKAGDIENMYKRDLEVMRNAIYARHGYSFQNRQMRHFFDHIDWYIPVSIDITKDLTALERENIALLKRYEQHATAYYDEFGR